LELLMHLLKKIVSSLLTLLLCTGFQSSSQLLEDSLNQKGGQLVTVKSQLSENEADQIQSHLRSLGINSTKEKAKSEQLLDMTDRVWEIKVRLVDSVEAIIALDKAGLPPVVKSHLFEEYMKRQRERYEMEKEEITLAEKVARELEKIKGVNDAEVLLTFQTTDDGAKGKVHATIYISHTGFLDDPGGPEMQRVKELIFGQIDDLTENNLTLINERNVQYKKNNKSK